MIKKLKKTAKIILIASGILIVAMVVIQDKCNKPLPIEPDNEFKLPIEIYRPPLVKIPFKKSHAEPIPARQLPIPTKDIDKTIEVGRDVVIVIDKKGKVYTTKDTPKDIPIKVTVWKPKALAFESRWGATVALAGKPNMYFCLSWSFLRVGKVKFGVDAGVNTDALGSGIMDDFLLGVAGRYRILKNNEIYLSAGYEFTHKTVYLGITIIF